MKYIASECPKLTSEFKMGFKSDETVRTFSLSNDKFMVYDSATKTCSFTIVENSVGANIKIGTNFLSS